MAVLFNINLVSANAVKLIAPFGVRPRFLGHGTADGVNDHALARRNAH